MRTAITTAATTVSVISAAHTAQIVPRVRVSIIERLKSAPTVSNLSFGSWYGKLHDAPDYLERLRAKVETFRNFDQILYQAGADLHVDDPLGGVLNTDQMRERDHIVFDAAKDAGVPLVWNLAGGYQDPISKVVRIHLATMEKCARLYIANPPHPTAVRRSENYATPFE
jgi:hypothetical protein